MAIAALPPARHTEAAGRDREDEEERTQRRREETPATRLATVTSTPELRIIYGNYNFYATVLNLTNLYWT